MKKTGFIQHLHKLLSLALVACMLLSLVPTAAFAAETMSYTDKYGTWLYQENDDGSITIVGYEGTKKNIVVPNNIGGKAVVALDDGVFKGNEHICAVVIPYGIQSIGAEVFADCPKLERVNLPGSLEAIGDGAFQNCDNLSMLYIPASVAEIGENAFKGSDNLTVNCSANTYAASYLEANKEEVNAYRIHDVQSETVIDRAPVAPVVDTVVEETAPVMPEKPSVEEKEDPDSEPETRPVPDGERLTYSFGLNKEYTLVLVDTMPGVKINLEDESVWDMLDARFFVVSLTKKTADGEETMIDLTTDAYIWLSQYDDQEYTMYLSWPASLEETNKIYPKNLTFDLENNLVGFKEVKKTAGKQSTVISDSATTEYSVASSLRIDRAADGTLLHSSDQYHKYIDRIYQDQDTDVFAARSKYKELDENGLFLEASDDKQLEITTGGVTIHGHVFWTFDEKGNVIAIGASQNESDADSCESIQGKDVYQDLDKDGSIVSIQYDSTAPIEDGIYKLEIMLYEKEVVDHHSYISSQIENDASGNVNVHEQTEDVTEKFADRLYFSEKVIRADSGEEINGSDDVLFENDPDEHRKDISERYIWSFSSKGNAVVTDLTTGEVITRDWLAKPEKMKDHTYIGDTGKYVGWDWEWEFIIDNIEDDGDLKNYTVNEYTYDQDTDTWKKTSVVVTTMGTYDETGKFVSAAGTDADFKKGLPSRILDGFTVDVDYYIFDDSDATGEDNWRWEENLWITSDQDGNGTDQVHRFVNGNETALVEDGKLIFGEADVDALVSAKDKALDIIKGNSTVTDGSGNVLSQREKKEDLLKLQEDLKDPSFYPSPEELYQEVLDMVPNGEGAELDAELDQEGIPESNVVVVASPTDLVY